MLSFFLRKPYCNAENRTINNSSTSAPSRNTVGLTIKKKLAMAGLNMEIIQEMYNNSSGDSLSEFFSQKIKTDTL
jgi:hypothetical protein